MIKGTEVSDLNHSATGAARGSSNEYQQYMFWSKNNNYISLKLEQIMIQLDIIAFSTSALDIRLPNAKKKKKEEKKRKKKRFSF